MSTKQVKKEEEEKAEVTFAMEYPLDKAIIAYGEEIKVIRMRAPDGDDLLAVGSPVIFYPHVDPPRVEHDLPKVIMMVARLAKIPSSSLRSLDTQDIMGLAWTISPFFTPAR